MSETHQQRETVDRFISATEQAKRALERKYRQEFSGLGRAKGHAIEQGDRVVKNHSDELGLLVKLRNAIQHSSVNGGLPIAIPREDAVIAMERIAGYIEKQPQVKDFMIKGPVTLSPENVIEEASERIVHGDLSQLPVYEKGTYIGLFTTNAMARWLGHSVHSEGGTLIVENVKVSEILEHAEPHEAAEFVKPVQSVLKVCETLSKETAPPAILVTTDGTASGQLQGIVTRFDVARILSAATVTYP